MPRVMKYCRRDLFVCLASFLPVDMNSQQWHQAENVLWVKKHSGMSLDTHTLLLCILPKNTQGGKKLILTSQTLIDIS